MNDSYISTESLNKQLDEAYNNAIDNAIYIVENIGLRTNPINPPNVVAGLIIQELKKLKS